MLTDVMGWCNVLTAHLDLITAAFGHVTNNHLPIS